MDKKTATRKPQPHISHPLQEARGLINRANHNVYRAGHIDTAFEIGKALERLKMAIHVLEVVQRNYPIAHPSMINLSQPPTDPSLCPSPEDESEKSS